jgi:hypothetical protein
MENYSTYLPRTAFIALLFALFVTSQVYAQCPVKKTGKQYGFFRVTNFKEKTCWLSEPFAYNVANGEIVNYNGMKECFKARVTALGGNVEHDVDEFGKERIVWLNNSYNPNDEVESSYNWFLPSVKACIKYMKQEISYKTGVGLEVKIVKMFGSGLINNADLNE